MRALHARALGHRFGDVAVLDDVSLSLAPGRVTVIMGPNGAGKSTLLRILAGLIRPKAGEVQLGGDVLHALPRRQVARLIAVMLAAPETAFAWTALELVVMGRAPHLALGRFESESDLRRAALALQRVGAEHLAARVFSTLSAGERQRVLIARALCQDTPVLLLDEPTSHLDPAHTLRIAALLHELAGEGRTIGCVMHDLDLAGRCADHLAMLNRGRIVAQGAPAEVLTSDIVREVYGVVGRQAEGEPTRFIVQGLDGPPDG